MVKVGFTDEELELLECGEEFPPRRKRVGIHRRRAGGRVYESPRITLPEKYRKFMGRHFRVYAGRAKVSSPGYERASGWSQEGDYLLLFFPDAWQI